MPNKLLTITITYNFKTIIRFTMILFGKCKAKAYVKKASTEKLQNPMIIIKIIICSVLQSINSGNYDIQMKSMVRRVHTETKVKT